MVVKKSCVTACPVEWPDGRGISGRMRVEWVAGSPWNRWSDAHGMGGQMTVESARWGRGTLQPGRIAKPVEWAMRRELLSPAYTTRWSELMVAKAK